MCVHHEPANDGRVGRPAPAGGKPGPATATPHHLTLSQRPCQGRTDVDPDPLGSIITVPMYKYLLTHIFSFLSGW